MNTAGIPVYTVSQVNGYVKDLMDGDPLLAGLLVRGEVSNYKCYPSGHHYFSLKDENAALRCVMFRGEAARLRFRPANGMRVVAFGRVSAFPRDGQYQLYCAELVQDGRGALDEAFEQLRRRLEAEGLFNEENKRPLPRYPKRIALVTSPAGAAVRDMLRILGARWPLAEVLVVPVRVQGTQAAGEIAAAIHRVNNRADIDLIITGRGGGSREDLWAFNEEAVAQAIFDCCVPVISAVGHETDTTIADFVADLRAPTPSAAAELAVYDIGQMEDKLAEYAYTMQHLCSTVIQRMRRETEQYGVRLKYVSPVNMIRMKRTQALSLEERLQNVMESQLMNRKHRLALYVEQMKGLSPLDKLNQGYSYVADTEGKTLSSVQQAAVGDQITVYVKDGRIRASVTGKETEEYLEEQNEEQG